MLHVQNCAQSGRVLVYLQLATSTSCVSKKHCRIGAVNLSSSSPTCDRVPPMTHILECVKLDYCMVHSEPQFVESSIS